VKFFIFPAIKQNFNIAFVCQINNFTRSFDEEKIVNIIGNTLAILQTGAI
jgi:hypothetical protein